MYIKKEMKTMSSTFAKPYFTSCLLKVVKGPNGAGASVRLFQGNYHYNVIVVTTISL